jgi:uncharacterized membrane protein YeaQ/YmgE (transglycosylase-associated protein family)
MPKSGPGSIYALLGIAGALVGARISDFLGFEFLSVGSALATILGAAFFVIGWRQLLPPKR